MSRFDIDFVDKNNEREMLMQRLRKTMNSLAERRYLDSKDTGDFLFCDGEFDLSKIDEGEWKPFGKNDFWGEREQYCRFKQTVTIPGEYDGKTVVYDITPYPHDSWTSNAEQFIVYLNGKMVQAIDHNHTYIFLGDPAKAGETFDIVLSAYCDDWSYRGPIQLRGALKVLDKELRNLYFDFAVPWETAHSYGADDLPRIEIIRHLNAAANLLELSTADFDVFKNSVREAAAYLKANIYGKSFDAVTSAIGHTHIDTAWLWRLKQTRQKAGRSFATVINLMKEYPEYKFMSSQPQLYEFVKQDYPELYEKIKAAVSRGQWEPEGGMWVEADTNVISGESLVRQILVGKRFFRREFGKDNRILWLPDVFGYSGALPQIMKLSGIEYFMTTKISWCEYNKFPFDTFNWKGINGTKILSHFIPSMSCSDDGWTTTYNAHLRPDLVIGGWRRYSNKNLNNNVLMSFGHGDGGGGPTRGQLECGIRMAKGVPGCPEVKMEFSRDFFDRLKNDVSGNPYLPEWAGELYLEFHRGTLTSQSRNKRFNRKSEYLYHDIETLAETAHILGTGEYPAEKLLEGWKIILTNQFHDIIPGSSIAAVYEDSKEEYLKILSEGGEMAKQAARSVAMKAATEGCSFVVENTLGFKRSEVVITDMPYENTVVYDLDGTVLPSQKTFDGRLAFLAKNVPSKGFKVFKLEENVASVKPDYCADISGAENEYFKFDFDSDMNIASLYHKETGRFVAPEGETLGRLYAFEDRPHSDEAWDIKCYYGEKYQVINDVQSKEVVERGPVRTVVKIVRKYNLSTITQYYIFYPHTARIDIVYDVDWQERQVLLKGDYPVDVNADRATFDIQFGNLQRTTHRNTTWDYAQFEVCGHKWADLSDNGFGLSVLSDCKYGWSVKDGRIMPSMLRSQERPNHLQDRERHTFTYALYPHSGAVCSSDVVHEAYSLNVPLYCVNTEQSNKGLGTEFSLVSADKANVIIETLKKAEDSDALIVRMYETWNKHTPCEVSFGVDIKEVYECNLMEEDCSPVASDGNTVNLVFKPFEIKTLKVVL